MYDSLVNAETIARTRRVPSPRPRIPHPRRRDTLARQLRKVADRLEN